MASCQSPEAPREQDPDVEKIAKEYFNDRRLGGRESVQIAKGVTLHGDQKQEGSDGIVRLSGRVFMDGDSSPDVGFMRLVPVGWPLHGYADFAEWNPASKSLSLRGSPIIEYPNGFCSSRGTLVLGPDSIRGVHNMVTFSQPTDATKAIE